MGVEPVGPMTTASFRFYQELNDFIAPERRGREFACVCERAATAGHMIEALGVPRSEVELVLVNGESVGFDRTLQDGDRVSVYPMFEAFDVTPLLRVRDGTLRTAGFIADAHLGGLAQLLRMLGFDTLYHNRFGDEEIERLAREQQRIVLTRDPTLLKRRAITHGCTVRALRPQRQLLEVFERLQLERAVRAFTRCLSCNGVLQAADRDSVAGEVPAGAPDHILRLGVCQGCARVFWEGTHWRRLRHRFERMAIPGMEEQG